MDFPEALVRAMVMWYNEDSPTVCRACKWKTRNAMRRELEDTFGENQNENRVQ